MITLALDRAKKLRRITATESIAQSGKNIFVKFTTNREQKQRYKNAL